MVGMAIVTNFGKGWYQSMALRGANPLATTQDFWMELNALWIVFVRDTYFTGGHMNPDHGVLGDIHTAGGGTHVVGYGSHKTATPWWTPSRILAWGFNNFPLPDIQNSSDTSSIDLIFNGVPLVFSFTGTATYPFTIGGLAVCCTNANGRGPTSAPDGVAANTQVIQIHEFTNPTSVTVTSSAQTLTLTGGKSILSEA